MKKRIVATMMAMVAAVSLMGCGITTTSTVTETTTDANGNTTTTTTTTTDGETTTETTTDAAPAVEGKVIIATDTVFRPFEYTNADGEFVGIDVDILEAVCADQGIDYELQSLGWDAAIAACQAGQANGMIAGASITDERKENGWIFSDGYYNATQCMSVAADSSVASFDDIAGMTVAVKTATQGASYAESIKDQYGFEISYFEDSPTMYQAVLGGQCVGCFEDTPIIKTFIKEDGLALKALDNTQNDGAPYGFAVFSADQQALVDAFNAGLANIKASGKYDEIIAKYLGE